MDAHEVRELLVGMRKRFDEGAKKIVDGLNEDNDKESVEQRITDARSEKAQELRIKVEDEIDLPMSRCRAAFDQWEIMEKCPLNEDASFMRAFRDLIAALEDFDPFKSDG